VWDIVTGNLLLQLLDHKDVVSDVAFNGTRLLASASFDGTCKIWDLKDEGNLSKTLTIDGKAFYGCCWSPDSKSFVGVGVSKVVFVWNTKDFQLRLKLSGHQHTIVACGYSPDGSLIATASWDTRVILWDSQRGNVVRQLCHVQPPPRMIYACGENGSWIHSLSFSPNGGLIATVCDDGLVRLWDIESQTNRQCAQLDQGLCCSFSPSSRYLAVGTRAGSVMFFQPQVPVQSLLFLSRSAIRMNLTIDPQDLRGKAIIPDGMTDYLAYQNS
jgi:WD repeat/SOCS box-containing protein 1